MSLLFGVSSMHEERVCICGEGQGGLVGVGGSVGISDKFLKWGEFFSYHSLS